MLRLLFSLTHAFLCSLYASAGRFFFFYFVLVSMGASDSEWPTPQRLNQALH